MRSKYVFLLSSIALIGLSITSCTAINLETNLDKPLSFTSKLDNEHYVVKSHFSKKLTANWILYGLVPLTRPDLDKSLSEMLNRYRGDGIVNLKIGTSYQPIDLFVNIFNPLTYSQKTVTLQGDIIKFKK